MKIITFRTHADEPEMSNSQFDSISEHLATQFQYLSPTFFSHWLKKIYHSDFIMILILECHKYKIFNNVRLFLEIVQDVSWTYDFMSLS